MNLLFCGGPKQGSLAWFTGTQRGSRQSNIIELIKTRATTQIQDCLVLPGLVLLPVSVQKPSPHPRISLSCLGVGTIDRSHVYFSVHFKESSSMSLFVLPYSIWVHLFIVSVGQTYAVLQPLKFRPYFSEFDGHQICPWYLWNEAFLGLEKIFATH